MQSAQASIEAVGYLGPAFRDPIEIFPGFGLSGFAMRFARNEEIFGELEEADFAYKVVSGAVRTFRVLSDGRRQVVGFHLAGEIFGLERGGLHLASAEAVSDCEVILIRRTVIEKASSANGEVARWLLGLANEELVRLREHMMRLGRKTAAERVAAFLLEMDGRCPNGGGMALPMSRGDIADYLGLTVETVSRVLSQYERCGIIAMTHCRQILLRDRRALQGADA